MERLIQSNTAKHKLIHRILPKTQEMKMLKWKENNEGNTNDNETVPSVLASTQNAYFKNCIDVKALVITSDNLERNTQSMPSSFYKFLHQLLDMRKQLLDFITIHVSRICWLTIDTTGSK